MPERTSRVAWVAAAVIAASWGTSCGASHEPPSMPAPAPLHAAEDLPAPATPPAPPGPGDWATWPHAKKGAYMRTTFLAEEQKVFAAYEPNRYRVLICRDCHGSGVDNSSYRMPNPDLPKLCGGPECFKELKEKEPEVLRFMQQRVVPETARLLGVTPFDMEKHVGFSCYQCHTRTEGR